MTVGILHIFWLPEQLDHSFATLNEVKVDGISKYIKDHGTNHIPCACARAHKTHIL